MTPHSTHSFSGPHNLCKCGIGRHSEQAGQPCRLTMRKWDVMFEGKKVGEVFSMTDEHALLIANLAYGKRDYVLIEKENK